MHLKFVLIYFSNKWTKTFRICCKFNFFFEFLIFWTTFRSISQNGENWEFWNGNERNSKTKGRMTIKFGTHINHSMVYKTMNPDFWICALNLNYSTKFPDWSAGGCHGNHIKNPDPWFCAHYTHAPSTQVWCNCKLPLSSYICSRV
jgi:hypothetical protein